MPSHLRVVSSLVLVVLAATLAGCTPQSRADLERYAEELRSQPAVDSIDVGVSTPLPFAVHGTLYTVLDGDLTRDEFDRFRDAACEDTVNASVYFELSFPLGAGVDLRQDGLPRCWGVRNQFIEATPVLRAALDVIRSVSWTERIYDDRDITEIRLDTEQSLVEKAALGREVLDAVIDTGGDFELGMSSLSLSGSLDEVRLLTSVVTEITAQFPVAEARFDESLVLRLDSIFPQDAEAARAWLEQHYPEVPVAGVVVSTVDLGNGTPSAEILAVAQAVQETGLAQSVKAGEYRLTVQTSGPGDSLEILDQVGPLADGAAIEFRSVLPGERRVTTSPALDASAAVQLRMLELTATLADELFADPQVKSILVDRLGIEVYTFDVEQDPATIDRLGRVILEALEESGLTMLYVTVDNRDVPGFDGG